MSKAAVVRTEAEIEMTDKIISGEVAVADLDDSIHDALTMLAEGGVYVETLIARAANVANWPEVERLVRLQNEALREYLLPTAQQEIERGAMYA